MVYIAVNLTKSKCTLKCVITMDFALLYAFKTIVIQCINIIIITHVSENFSEKTQISSLCIGGHTCIYYIGKYILIQFGVGWYIFCPLDIPICKFSTYSLFEYTYMAMTIWPQSSFPLAVTDKIKSHLEAATEEMSIEEVVSISWKLDPLIKRYPIWLYLTTYTAVHVHPSNISTLYVSYKSSWCVLQITRRIISIDSEIIEK